VVYLKEIKTKFAALVFEPASLKTALGKVERPKMQRKQKLKRRRKGSTKKALCLTVVTDVGFFQENHHCGEPLGRGFITAAQSTHSGPQGHLVYYLG
jgi:hypothetical protein